jgi:cell division protein FtsL|tara:strand:- start:648 stop:839 length:192 start_codon:yes stop_codon:yes gene_type:complete
MGKHYFSTDDGQKHVFTGELKDLDSHISQKQAAAKTNIQNKKADFAALTDKQKIDVIAKRLGL